MAKRIMVVEDEHGIQELLRLNLTMAGFEVGQSLSVEDALGELVAFAPDLLIVDWNLPLKSGVNLVRLLRSKSDTSQVPIIMLTARESELDKIYAFDSGVDDYVTKPFRVRELLARVQALLRRAQQQREVVPEVIEVDGLCLNHEERLVSVKGRVLDLGPVEYRLLHYLICRPLRVHSRDELLTQVWGDRADLQERTVDAYVSRLRNVIEGAGHHCCIETVRSMGYRFIRLQGNPAEREVLLSA